eukprot:NODE_414_length_9102_cov_0.404754.p5 type:complete len:197 gc:universal NODE_414_length_9102_cov_0.404754:4172-4762(+)
MIKRFVKVLAHEVELGQYIKYKGNLMRATSVTHSHLGRGGASLKISLQSTLNGGCQNVSFRPSEQLELVDVDWQQFIVVEKDKKAIYIDNDGEIESIALDLIENSEFVEAGMKVNVAKDENDFISCKLPNSHVYTISAVSEDIVKQRVKGTTSVKATLSSSAVLKVPSFIKVNDKIEVGLRDFAYKRRVSTLSEKL